VAAGQDKDDDEFGGPRRKSKDHVLENVGEEVRQHHEAGVEEGRRQAGDQRFRHRPVELRQHNVQQ
jgi:hypothetical protein